MPELIPNLNNLPLASNNFINADGGIQAHTINHLTFSPQINLPENLTPEYLAQLKAMFKGIPLALPEEHVSHLEEWTSLSSEHYNLFVLENEEYESGTFSISKNVSICRYMRSEDVEFFRILSDNTKNDLFNMPCIFAKRNQNFGSTDDNHPALLGRITGIVVQRYNLKISFYGYQPIQQQMINDNPHLFGLATSSLRTELDEEHWSIKRVNLIQVIEQLGIRVE